jgi:hypothetical protein
MLEPQPPLGARVPLGQRFWVCTYHHCSIKGFQVSVDG